MFTDSNIKEFLRSKKFSKKTKESYIATFSEAQALLAEHAEITPDSEIFYHELEQRFRDKNISDAEIQTHIERVKELINFAKGMKGDDTMPENEDIMQVEPATEAEAVITPEPFEPARRGRPKNTDGKRKEGFNLQIEPALREKLNILAEYDECSATEFITHLIEQAINARHEDIEYVLNYKYGLRARKAQQQATL